MLFKKKSTANTGHQQNSPVQYQAPQPNVSVTLPMYRLVKLRKLWLGSMFFLGMFSQFLLAIYTPAVWNYLYGLLQNFLPVV